MSVLPELRTGVSTERALAVFDALPAVQVQDVLGSWRGSEVPTGHRLDGLLGAFAWHGKRFRGPDDVDPLVMEGGWALDPAKVPMQLALHAGPVVTQPAVAAVLRRGLLPLLRTRRPRARLRMTEYRGVVTATMAYDALPVHDVFRAVDDRTLLGAMDMRWDPAPFFFLLEREA